MTKLLTIEEHNYRTLNTKRGKSGIACPKCGNEMHYNSDNMMLSNPPQRSVKCSNCEYITNVYI